MPKKSTYDYVTKTLTYSGKRYYVRGKNEREALKKLVQLEKNLESGVKNLNEKTTVKKWAEEWMDVYVKPRDITQKSADMYQQKLSRYILPEIGSMKISDVKDTQLQKILNGANTSWSTAQKVKITLQAMFKQARKSRLIIFDPSEDLSAPKAPKGTHRSITGQERKAILEVAKYHHAGLFVLLMLYCGIRPGEAIALQWKDVGWEHHILHISKAIESGHTRAVKGPKSASGIRDVPIPDGLYARLLAEKSGPFEPVLLQPVGKKQHTHDTIGAAWKNFKRELDIHMGATVYRNQIIKSVVADDLVPYCLRHTYCTDLQRAGVPLNVAKYLMGHSDVSVTANIYTETTPDVVNLAAVKMEKYYCNSHDEPQSSESAANKSIQKSIG